MKPTVELSTIVERHTNPDDPQTLIEMGLAELEHGGRPGAALVHFERACELSPESASGWLYAGVCLVRMAKLTEALVRLEQAANLGLQTGLLYQTAGDAHFHAGHFDQAHAAYAQVAAMGEASPLSEARMGACEVNLGSMPEGLRRIQQAVASARACGELYDILAAAALRAGELKLAAQALQDRFRLGKPTDLHFELAAILQTESKAKRDVQALQTSA
jgi:tetratricopeptide (TPR) repeat protein